jgi:hypothetical protein
MMGILCPIKHWSHAKGKSTKHVLTSSHKCYILLSMFTTTQLAPTNVLPCDCVHLPIIILALYLYGVELHQHF